MMSQEEYMEEIKPLREQGWTLEEIGAHTGYHPATISKWCRQSSTTTNWMPSWSMTKRVSARSRRS